MINSVFALWAKALEVVIHFLERSWAGSIVETVTGKTAIISALFAVLRCVRVLQITLATRNEPDVD
jgi:hypothetical protein